MKNNVATPGMRYSDAAVATQDNTSLATHDASKFRRTPTEAANIKRHLLMKGKCRECNRTTSHEIVCKYEEKIENDLATPFNYDIKYWKIIKCRGCETISFCMSKHLSNDEKNTFDFLYPLREKRLKKEFPNAPATLQIPYHETIESFNNLHKTLCVAGIRSIIEAICLDKKIEGKKEIKKRACCKVEYEKL